MKIKIFSNNSVAVIQREIQTWLNEHPQVSINTILQSESWVALDNGGWSLTITLFYIG
jgi:hypothetical protein